MLPANSLESWRVARQHGRRPPWKGLGGVFESRDLFSKKLDEALPLRSLATGALSLTGTIT